MKLSQTRGLIRIESEIKNGGVFYRRRALLSSTELTIPFEHIGDDIVRTFHVPRPNLLICVVFGLALGYRLVRLISTGDVTPFAMFASITLFAFSLFMAWVISPREVGYLTTSGALLFVDAAGRHDPAPYLEEIQRAKAAHMRQLYGDHNDDVTRSTSNQPPLH